MSKKRPNLSPYLHNLLKMSHVELNEILDNIRRLSDKHEILIKVLLEEENCYTNKGRLNKSSLSRILGLKPKEIDDMFYDCQKEMIK